MIRLLVILLVAATPALADPGVEALSAFRVQNGLPAVRHSEKLDAMARAHALDLSRTGRFSHQGSDGSDIGSRARGVGYGYCRLAENIAKGQRSLAEVMRSWANSPGHRRNMTLRDVTEAALVRTSDDVWVMVLGRPGC
ncbi:Cysteine-rich secretory protein family protein [Roseivivax halotolerans]|uniref:Cysteine-rich secretory protein family protein n=1 Tax=Roseivivax halotolerans TaxID=93684 RepID=A0A1I5ZI33_9RHOB|nr:MULTISPECIES: CAP domain-containing protein [Roseivivax]QFT62519.1 Cysteine-rich secretory protein family protein [Roseivivax sp. THAF30]SFQ56118.1 Cysteine-rich secretory protein family protein [Roseivivax halotolerans]